MKLINGFIEYPSNMVALNYMNITYRIREDVYPSNMVALNSKIMDIFMFFRKFLEYFIKIM